MQPSDFRYASELGYAIKLLAIGKLVDGGLEARVHPTLVPAGTMLASVDDVFNAVQVEGDLVGRILFYGRGAGAGPTASAVVADIIDLAQRIAGGVIRPTVAVYDEIDQAPPDGGRLEPLLPAAGGGGPPRRDRADRRHPRRAADQPDLGDPEGRRAQRRWRPHAEIVFMTHLAHEAAVQAALQEIRSLTSSSGSAASSGSRTDVGI